MKVLCRSFHKRPLWCGLFVKVGADFVVHSPSLLRSSTSTVLDGTWNLANTTFACYLVSNPESEYRIRQIAASFLHFHRLCVTSVHSVLDLSVSRFARLLFRDVPAFASSASKDRAIKRLRLTLLRNGGVYSDACQIVDNFLGLSPTPLEPAAYPNCQTPTRQTIAAIIESDLGLRVRDAFSALSTTPSAVSGCVFHYDARLRSGEPVTVSIVPPHLSRMREYDLFPFRVLASLLAFSGPEGNLLDACVDRLSFSMRKEWQARKKLLENFGVRFDGQVRDCFKKSKSLNLGVFVPAPIPDLSADHVMVTDQHFYEKPIAATSKIVNAVGRFERQLSAHNGLVLPNVSLSNIRVLNGRVSLDRFASLAQTGKGDLGKLRAIETAMASQNWRKIKAAGKAWGITVGDQFGGIGEWLRIGRAVARRSAAGLVAEAETVACLAALSAATVREAKRKTMGAEAHLRAALGQL
jgi:hypothetical protein